MAERLGKYAHELMNELSSADIAEYMALDILKGDEYKTLLESKMMSEEERNAKIIKMFGGK